MTEAEARSWLERRVPRETMEKLEAFVAMIGDEIPRQNLIAASTADHIWARHIVDSAQLVPLLNGAPQKWLDLGSGPGFPGIVAALLLDQTCFTLVESRRKRIDFLRNVAAALGLDPRVEIAGARLEAIPTVGHDVISARAFAPLDRLLSLAHRFSGAGTTWLLPKGRSAASELEAVAPSWQGAFRIVPSLTDPDAAIIIARDVQPRRKGPTRR